MKQAVGAFCVVIIIGGLVAWSAFSSEDDRICQRGYAESVRPPKAATDQVKREMMKEQNIPLHRIGEFELDHIVPLSLGGAPLDRKNLRLQPWRGPWNAHDKDRLENELHYQACRQHALLLAQARAMLSGNWCDSYVKILGGAAGTDAQRPQECRK
jgi:hypothetical protein